MGPRHHILATDESKPIVQNVCQTLGGEGKPVGEGIEANLLVPPEAETDGPESRQESGSFLWGLPGGHHLPVLARLQCFEQ